MDPSINQQVADHLETQLQAYLSNGTQSITVEKAFRIALEMETSEVDVMYTKLLQSCGPKVAQTMAKFGVPANVQRAKLKAAIHTKLLQSCGPKVAQTMAKFGVPANVQRAKLKAAILRFSMEPKLRAAAQSL
jgi:hypothetical protein